MFLVGTAHDTPTASNFDATLVLSLLLSQHGGGYHGGTNTTAPGDAAEGQRRAQGASGGVEIEAADREGEDAEGLRGTGRQALSLIAW